MEAAVMSPRVLSLAVLALGAGCGALSRVSRLDPAVPRIVAQQLPIAVGVYYAPELRDHEQVRMRDPSSRWIVPGGQATVAVLRRALPRVFARVEEVQARTPPPGLDAVVEPSIDELDFAFPVLAGPYRANLQLRLTLYDRAGVPVESVVAQGTGERDWGLDYLTHDTPIGQVATRALEEAVAHLLSGFGDRPQVRRWLARLQAPASEEPDATPPLRIEAQASALENHRQRALFGAELAGVGVVALAVRVHNSGERAVVVRASDLRLLPPDGAELEPAGVTRVLARLEGETPCAEADREQRQRQAGAARFPEQTVVQAGAEAGGVVFFAPPPRTNDFSSARLRIPLVDAETRAGAVVERPVGGLAFRAAHVRSWSPVIAPAPAAVFGTEGAGSPCQAVPGLAQTYRCPGGLSCREGRCVAASAHPPARQPTRLETAPALATGPTIATGRGRALIVLGIGASFGRDTPGRLEDGSEGVALILGAGFRPLRWLSLELPIEFDLRSYSTRTIPARLLVRFDDRMSLFTAWFPGSVRAIVPLGRIAELYGGAGGGFALARLTATGQLVGLQAPVEVSDTTVVLAGQWFAGFEATVSRHFNLGFEYRHDYADADFGELFNGSADIGAHTLAVRVSVY